MTEMTAGVDRFHRDHWDPQKLKHGRRITVKGPPTRAFGDVKESIAARKRIADREVMRVELMGTVNQLDIPQDARNLLKEAPCTLKTGSIEAEEMQKKLIRAQTELAEEKKIVEGLRVHATNLRRCIERLTKKHGWMSYDSLHNSKEMQRDMGDWFFFEDMPTLDAFMNWILHECPEEHWNWYAGIAEDAFGEDEAEGDDGGDGSGDDDGADGSSDDSGDGSSSTSSHEDSDDESCDGGGEGDRDAGAGDGPRKRRRRQSGMGTRTHLSCRDAIMLFLVTVRAGLTFKRVGKLFGCHYTTASRAFVTVLSLLKTIFKYTFHQLDTETLQGLVPDSFRNAETEEGEVHLVHLFDAFELFCQKPFSDIMRLIMWSEYKHQYTAKFFLDILSNGTCYYVSEAYGGCIDDRTLTKVCGFLKLLEAGQDALADKGFLVHDLLAEVACVLFVPPKMRPNRHQQPTQEERQTSKVAQKRIFVESGVGRIRFFNIFDHRVRISNIHLISDIVYVCAMMTNFNRPYLPINRAIADAGADEH